MDVRLDPSGGGPDVVDGAAGWITVGHVRILGEGGPWTGGRNAETAARACYHPAATRGVAVHRPRTEMHPLNLIRLVPAEGTWPEDAIDGVPDPPRLATSPIGPTRPERSPR